MKTVYSFVCMIALLGALSIFTTGIARAQASDKILAVTAGPGVEGQALTVTAELTRTTQIGQVLVAFRQYGTSEFRQVEAQITGNKASATIRSADVIAPAIEYFVIVRAQGRDSMETYTYPSENPEAHPLRAEIQGAGSQDKTIIFLSPEPGGSGTLEDLLVSVSLIKVDSTIKKSATKILIDERDVTAYAVISEDLITLAPENINPPLAEGPHVVRVELYGNDGSLARKSSVSFSQVSLATAGAAASALQYNVSAQVEARNENISDVATQYNRGTMNLTSQYGPLQVNGRLYMTNEDKDNRQPQNRYYIEAKTSWLRASYGDAYPTFPSLIMSGKRVRGVTANLALGFFNVDFANGETVRKVEGDTVMTFDKTAANAPTNTDPNGGSYKPYPGGAYGANTWAKYSYGTFSRQLTAIRPSFGKGENFQWGFTYLKAKDDVGSIVYGIKPQENIAFGSDMTIGMDNRNILITAQGGASVYNTDIAGGSLTDSQIDTLFRGSDSTQKRQDLRNLRDKINPFITVNQNIVPLGIDKITSIMAGEAAISLNYFDNLLKGGYIFRGSQYNSFGANFLRKDVKGINLFDRIRLIQNQLFVSVGIERLEDNLDASKLATTSYNTWNTTVSYFPRFNFPNLTVGYGENKNSNGLAVYDPNDVTSNLNATRGKAAIEEKNSRYFVQTGYDFTAKYRHNIQLAVSNASKDDQTYLRANTKNMTISSVLTTSWNIPLQTAVGLALNTNQIPQFPTPGQAAFLVDYNYTSVNLSARYRLMDEKLRLFALLSPTFGDFKRTMWDASAEYNLMRDVWAVSEFSILQSPGVPTDAIWSILLRYNM